MLDRSPQRMFTLVTAMATLCITASISSAGDPGDRCMPGCGFCRDKCCVTSAKPGKQNKHCWEVECAEVCIPAVRFPWNCRNDNGCDACLSQHLPKCGKVRCVRKLKKVEYECDVCEYEHKIVDRCPHCSDVGPQDCLLPTKLQHGSNAATPASRAEAAPQPPATPVPEKRRFGRSLLQALNLRQHQDPVDP